MKIRPAGLHGAFLIEPAVHEDERGFFMETFRKNAFAEAGIAADFVQDNHSLSRRGALRGLHYQLLHPQGKLVRVVHGEVFDVAVDLRRSSPTFGRQMSIILSEANRLLFYVPPGCAHGFCVLSEVAEFTYRCTDYYHPEDEHTLLWNDPPLGIDWPVTDPILSPKDRRGVPLAEAACYD
jgi:dTDP-4-dehydrorhamnose 3,5-epimerase